MCREEIVCIEKIVDIQATYTVLDLKLSMLFEEINKECIKGIIDILHFKILMSALRDVPFKDEQKAQQLYMELVECLDNEYYGSSKEWSIYTILKKIKELQKYILWDYIINGSFTLYPDETGWWELKVDIVRSKEFYHLFSMLEI